MSEPPQAEPRRRLPRVIFFNAAVALLLVASAGIVIWWNSVDDATCASGALACGEGTCCEGGGGGPIEPEDPETVQFTGATDLTAGAAPFAKEGYLDLAPDVWIPDLELAGWTPVAEDELVDATLGFESDGVQVACYTAQARNIAIADFLDVESVYSAIAVAQRARFDEASLFERVGEPEYGRYVIDGNAALAAEADYAWTRAVDPETGETREGEWSERWGFVAVYRGSTGAAICSYGGPADAEPLDEIQDHLLGIRLSD